MIRIGCVPSCAVTVALIATGAGPLAAQDAAPAVAPEQIVAWLDELSNWGRWGPEDELGTLNLITDAKRRAAAALVQEGVAVSLARDVDKAEAPDNPTPIGHEARFSGARVGWGMDSYTIDYHGYSYSHLDALPHTGFDGKLYNGYSTETVASGGAERLGIAVMRLGIFTRGVLIDLPRHLGVPFLEPGTAVTADVLESWERASGVRIEPGDVLLIRTGRWAKRAQDGPWRAGALLAGLHASAAPWLRARDVAVIGSDGVTDVLPSGVQGFSHPLHQIALVAMGTPLLDNLNLEALAEATAARRRWTFLLSVAPIRIPGGLGSPVNPIAVF
jgi:kynurenine formamidase